MIGRYFQDIGIGHLAGCLNRRDHHHPRLPITSDPGFEGHDVGHEEWPFFFGNLIRKKVAPQNVAPLKGDQLSECT